MTNDNGFLQSYSFGEWFDVISIEWFIRCDEPMDTDEISANLGIQPTRCHTQGELFWTTVRNPDTDELYKEQIPNPNSVWNVNTQDVSGLEKVEDHIRYLLGILEPAREKMQPYLKNKEKYAVGVWINVEWDWDEEGVRRGYTIDGELMLRLASICHYIEFNMYRLDRK